MFLCSLLTHIGEIDHTHTLLVKVSVT